MLKSQKSFYCNFFVFYLLKLKVIIIYMSSKSQNKTSNSVTTLEPVFEISPSSQQFKWILLIFSNLAASAQETAQRNESNV